MRIFLTVDGTQYLAHLKFVPGGGGSYEVQSNPPDIEVLSIEVGGRSLTDTEVEELLDRDDNRYLGELVDAAEKEYDDNLQTMLDY